jgi:hypothetical protein
MQWSVNSLSTGCPEDVYTRLRPRREMTAARVDNDGLRVSPSLPMSHCSLPRSAALWTLALLALVGCASDPLESPDFGPASEGALRLALTPTEGARVGGHVELTAVLTNSGERPLVFDARPPTTVARPDDRWVVRHASGWADPSPWWEDAGLARGLPDSLRVDNQGPVEWQVPLSDWVRFDSPGRYAVQLVTSRGTEEIVSNAVAITVGPRDSGADQAAVERITDALSGEPSAAERSRLFRELAAIGTPATRALALDHLAKGPEDESGWVLVLARDPDPKATRQALDAAIADPAIGIGHGHIRAMEALVYDAEFDTAAPPRPGGIDRKAQSAWQEKMDARAAVRDAARQAAFDASAKALDAKSDPGPTLGTLALMAAREELEGEAAVWTRARTGLASIPEPALGELVGRYFYDLTASGPLDRPTEAVVDELIPQLVAVATDDAVPNPTRLAVLERLVQLDVLDEPAVVQAFESLIADPARSLADADVLLRALPSVSQPTQQAIVAGLATAADPIQQARLLGQYVDETHAEAVRTAWAAVPPDAPTGILAGYLAWFLNHAPDGPEATSILRRFGPDHAFLLTLTAELVDDPSPMEPYAMRGLESPEQAVIFKSSDFIIDYGSPELAPALHALIGRVDEQNEEGAMGALVASRGWLIDNPTRNALGPTLDDKRADMILRSVKSSTKTMVILEARVDGWDPVVELNYREYVGADALREKFSQFEPGTVIRLKYRGIEPARAHELFGPPVEAAGLTLFQPSD